ncbi:MAG TPA: acetate--CoA ligase family protein [Candidatus Egerieousia sp.]|nr:acetate--CoA ligase family protein [Candidatus Egerieousia sp.]
MITEQLIKPKSIAVIGGSNDPSRPGGGALKNLIINNFQGDIYAISKNEQNVQGMRTYSSVNDIPDSDLAIIAEDDGCCVDTVETLCGKKECGAIIICSNIISQKGMTQENAEKKIAEIAKNYGATIIGPNSAGIVTPWYSSIFTDTITCAKEGIDIISSSRTTIAFLVASAIKYGIKISNIISVGYSIQTSVEDVIEWMDEYYDAKTCEKKVIAVYIEKISDSEKLLKHSRSLVNKGAGIVAIKGGCSNDEITLGISHTGMLASPTKAVGALFAKCGIIRAYGREEMMNIAGILSKPRPKGKKIAVLTQAGGPAVMLTDALEHNGIDVQKVFFEDYMYGKTAGQMSALMDQYDTDPQIDATAVIFGCPGLSDSAEIYNVLFRKIKATPKPIYPVFPSTSHSEAYIKEYHNKGGITFTDEVVFGKALADVLNAPRVFADSSSPAIDKQMIRDIIKKSPDGWMPPFMVQELMDASGINRTKQEIALTANEAVKAAIEIGYPIAMKVIGPINKIDIDGVSLNISDEHTLKTEFERMTNIEGVSGVLIQPMLEGIEVFIGVKREKNFGPMVMCGLGGIFVEVIKDVRSALAPVSENEANKMIHSLKGYPIISGYRGQEGVNEIMFNETIRRVSALCMVAPEIVEMDLNPLIGNERRLTAIDVKIRIEKTSD